MREKNATVLKGTGSLVHQMLTVPTTSNSEKASCEIPSLVHPHRPGLMLNQYNTWLAECRKIPVHLLCNFCRCRAVFLYYFTPALFQYFSGPSILTYLKCCFAETFLLVFRLVKVRVMQSEAIN